MSSSEDYKVIGRTLFEQQSRPQFQKWKKAMPNKEFSAFGERLSLWYKDPFNEEILESHAVGGIHGDGDNLLWRAKMDEQKRRLFFYVNHTAKEVMPIEVTNDHSYEDSRLDKHCRKGVGMLKTLDAEKDRLAIEKIQNIAFESQCTCHRLLMAEESVA